MKRKNPDTSLSAYKSAKLGLIEGHKKIILAAFERLGSATADQIAEYTGMDHVQINRRFVDLANDEKIYNTQLKKPTRRGRDAFIWCLTAGRKIEKPSIKEERSMHEFAESVIRATNSIQRTIFD